MTELERVSSHTLHCNAVHSPVASALHVCKCTQSQCIFLSLFQTVRTTALIVGTFVVGWGPAMVKFLLVCDECPIKPGSIDLTTNIALGAIVNTIYCLKV